MIKKSLFATTLLVVLSACNQSPKIESEYNFEERETALVSDIVKDYSLVPLELTESNQILDASEVKVTSDKIFVLDCYSPVNKTLYVFNMEGKYLGQVGNAGEGPGEYIMPLSFLVNEGQNLIYIMDIATNKLNTYKMDTFEFVQDFPLSFYSTCNALYNDNQFIWYIGSGLRNEGDLQKHIQITDTQCQVETSLIDCLDMPTRGLYNIKNCFMMADGEMFFHHPFLGDYEKISEGMSTPAFSLKFNNHNFPNTAYLSENKGEIIEKLKEDGYIQFCDAMMTKKNMACYFGVDKDAYWGIYDRKEAKGWYIDKAKIEDDLGIGSLARPKTVFNDSFVSVIYTEKLDELPESSILFKNGKDKISENPVILFFKP